jgi:hypothetical protein
MLRDPSLGPSAALEWLDALSAMIADGARQYLMMGTQSY